MLSSSHPKTKFAQTNANIELLFKLLSRDNVQYAQACWELLAYLPRNSQIEKDIKELNLEHGWELLLDSSSLYRFLYALQIIEETVKAKSSKEWIEKFIKKEGGNQLFSCLLNIPINTISQPLSRKCFVLLLAIIVGIFKDNLLNSVSLYQARRNEIICRILIAIEEFTKSPTASKESAYNEEEDDAASFDYFELDYRENNEEVEAVSNGFKLIKGTFKEDYNYFEQIVNFPRFIDLMKNGIIQCSNRELRKRFVEEIFFICKDYEKFFDFSITPHRVIPDILINNLLKEVIDPRKDYSKFYELLKHVIELFPKELLMQLPIDHLAVIEGYSKMLTDHVSTERDANDNDAMLTNLLILLEASLKKFSEYKLEVGQGRVGLLNEVLHPCLFDYPTSGNRSTYNTNESLAPKCKSKHTRTAAFNLLFTLVQDTEENLSVILNYLPRLHLSGPWRVNSRNEWDLTSPATEKSSTGYVGIKNLSCICYMNSLLQQLYMIPSFRNGIVSARNRDVSKDRSYTALPKDEMLVQLQYLFTALHESVRQYCNPGNFCQAFKDWEGNPINHVEQMDVDEFFNMLMDKLEGALGETDKLGLIKDHFGGTYLNQIICRDCPHKRELEEPFLAINLQLKNKTSLQDAIKSFVEGEVMEGSNAYSCEICEKKVSAMKKVCIKTLPDNLIFVLKRFSYNYDIMQKIKLNDYCEFPMTLNMDPYMIEQLDKNAMTDTNANVYKLVGIIVHRGVADSGHYYSFIQDREDEQKWFKFNDTIVTPFDPDRIKEEVFGGEEQWSDGIKKHKSEKVSNAYMLFYEKVNLKNAAATSFDVLAEIRNAILQDNIKYWQSKFFLGKDYIRFMEHLGYAWATPKTIHKITSENFPNQQLDIKVQIEPGERNYLGVFQYITAVMVTVFMRARNKKYMHDFSSLMQFYIENYPSVAEWLLWEFSSERVLEELMLGAIPPEVHLVVIELLTKALKTLSIENKDQINSSKPCIAVNFINIMVSKLSELWQYKSRGFYCYRLLSRISLLGPEIRQHLKNIETIKRIIYLLLDVSPPTQKLKTELHFTLNPCPYFGLPEGWEIDKYVISMDSLDYSFVVHCLSTLLRSCKYSKEESPLALQPLMAFNDNNILDILTGFSIIERIFFDCKYKIGPNSFFKAIAHLSWEGPELRRFFCNSLMKILKRYDYDEVEIKTIFRAIYILTKYHDSHVSEFLDDVLSDINRIAKKYNYAYYFTYFIGDQLTKICQQNVLIRNALRKATFEFEWLRDYFNENPYLPSINSHWTIKLYKNEGRNNKILLNNMQCDFSDLQYQSKSKVKAILDLLNKFMEEDITESADDEVERPDSEDDCYETNFEEGEVVECLVKCEPNATKWVEAVVKKYTGESILVAYKYNEKEHTLWVDLSTHIIAKKGTHEISNSQDQMSTCKENDSNDLSNTPGFGNS